MIYRPYSERIPDAQYQNVLREILENGIEGESQQEVDCITKMVPTPMHFRFENGFPIITERDIGGFWRQSVGEIFAFINGARTLKQLEEYGCYWWKSWGTPEKCAKRGLEPGDLGPGSYGAAFHDFPTAEGKPFNQVQHVIEQIKELPHLRTHFISPWIPQYIGRGKGKQQKVVVAPCHGWMQIRILGNKLTLVMIQRSADVPVGVPANMVQYAALTLAFALITGYEPYEYIHVLIDAHIYENQISYVKEILKREPRKFPTLEIRPDINFKDIFEFHSGNFVLSDYDPYPAIKGIPVAI
ncbi:MAG: thymidylate synthase [Patescibacteria group bacterium]